MKKHRRLRAESSAVARLLRLVLNGASRNQTPISEPWASWQRLCPEVQFRLQRVGNDGGMWVAFGFSDDHDDESAVLRSNWLTVDSGLLRTVLHDGVVDRSLERDLAAIGQRVREAGFGDLIDSLIEGRLPRVVRREHVSRRLLDERRANVRVQVRARLLYAGTTVSMHHLPGFKSAEAQRAGHECWQEAFVTLEFLEHKRVHVDTRRRVEGKRRGERRAQHSMRGLRREIIGILEDEADLIVDVLTGHARRVVGVSSIGEQRLRHEDRFDEGQGPHRQIPVLADADPFIEGTDLLQQTPPHDEVAG